MKKIVDFFAEVKQELSEVTWPTRTEVTRLTLIVIGISVIVAFFVGGADFLFTKILGLVVIR